MNRIAGLVFSGFACKFYAAGVAVWVVWEASNLIAETFARIGVGF